MAVSEAHKKASYKYNASRDSNTSAGRVPSAKGKGAAIRAAAVASGKSLQNYILDALNAKMQQEGQPLEIDPAESGEEGGL